MDIGQALERPDLESNLLRLNGDTLIVPRISETVRIQGGVQNPSVINFDPRLKHADYISQAGGYAKRALKKACLSPTQTEERTEPRIIFFWTYPKIKPGAILTIPIKQFETSSERTPGERVGLFSFISSMLSTITLAVIWISRSK